MPRKRPSRSWATSLDPIASANDPIFLFHHANVDRNYEKWLRRHLFREGEWLPLSVVHNFDYPTAGLVKGNNLDDILASHNVPFSDLLGESKGGKPVFNYTVLQALGMYDQEIYVYNSLELDYAPDSHDHGLMDVMPMQSFPGHGRSQRCDVPTQESCSLASTGVRSCSPSLCPPCAAWRP